MLRLFIVLSLFCGLCFPVVSQEFSPHLHAHAHNDYEHARPLKDALQNRFISVEADVYFQNGKLLVSHHRPGNRAGTLEKLYLQPLDSLLKANGGHVYRGFPGKFYLMIDCKTNAESTYQAIWKTLESYPDLLCTGVNCPVKIFLSGNRPIQTIAEKRHAGIAIDGRPDDLGKSYDPDVMPVISDHFRNWSKWNGKSNPSEEDLQRIRELAQRVHGEGKMLRLWAIPDNEVVWSALLEVGVDFINTDHLQGLNEFLTKKGL